MSSATRTEKKVFWQNAIIKEISNCAGSRLVSYDSRPFFLSYTENNIDLTSRRSEKPDVKVNYSKRSV